MKPILDAQYDQWQQSFSERPDMFGAESSEPARRALQLFQSERAVRLLELGGGQGRDTLYFARSGLNVTMLDYLENAVSSVNARAAELGLASSLRAARHDVRSPFPFPEDSFDACYSHMLYCMALTIDDLQFLSGEVGRVLLPGALQIYTVRHTEDPHYGTGIHRGEDMYEVGGFIVHFFDRAKIDRLAKGFAVVSVEKFEEGKLPRKLYMVTLRKL